MSVPLEGVSGTESYVTIESKLHFVDLAGSERLKNTGASGERAKEGISINSGLASLGKVIAQLSSRQAGSHVSYRDSKLTRLLQDSLGGNAITYMIACVTPAEFYLSETLNTVQYAQRARAIQSKPQIQHIPDDSDKQAAIDRLRAEVAFLRQQIRSAEGGERRNGIHPERTDRQNERELELQNHLLNVQEHYTTLSQRHAKLISDLTKSGDAGGDATVLNHISGESAVDRLKRSRANQEQIEQVVLEYEKTIQSLEASLSTTRSSLSNIESSLMERETKCAYVETVNQQLHSRVQKLMERETNTETYLRELEARLDGHSSGEERSGAVVSELRKEIGRIRESESNAEDYISTLEERLAEADQDMELMQREVERLEHVVERQRSLGKLDNLLFELDNVQNGSKAADDIQAIQNCSPTLNHDHNLEKRVSMEMLREAEETALPVQTDDELTTPPEVDEIPEVHDQEYDNGLDELQRAVNASLLAQPTTESFPTISDMSYSSPAQSKFITEKFETVSQELVDLRLEHESTVNELDVLSAKYQTALRTLAEMQAEMQEIVDDDHRPTAPGVVSPESTSRPESFLEDARMNKSKYGGGHLSSSRSLSSELSLAGESPTSTEPSDITPIVRDSSSFESSSREIERLQKLLAEHEHDMEMANQEYAQLKRDHQSTLDTVDELKTDLQRSRMNGPPSPLHIPGKIRRMNSTLVANPDRTNRSIGALRSIVAEELEGRPDKIESIEVHLSAAAHELQSRYERVQALEAENKTVKKEMEVKSTIISGLARERSSLKPSSPADLSMLSQMRDQLMQSENEARSLREALSRREQELQKEILSLKASQATHDHLMAVQGLDPHNSNERINELQDELSQWQAKHKSAVESSQDLEKQLLATIAQLEAAKADAETRPIHKSDGHVGLTGERAADATAIRFEPEQYKRLVDDLRYQIEEQNNAINGHVKSIEDLEQQQDDTRELTRKHGEEVEAKNTEIEKHRERISELEKEVEKQQSAVEFHKHGLKSLH